MASPLEDETFFSRSGTSSPDGKLNVHVPVVMSQQMHDDLIGCAFAMQKGKSEYIREVLREHLYGKKAAIQSKVSGIEPDSDDRNLP